MYLGGFMSTFLTRAQSRGTAVSAALLLTALAAFSGPSAEAKPPTRPGNVTKLAVGAVTKPADVYQVPTTWTAGSNTTSYRVTATNSSGVVVDKATVTSTDWLATVPGTTVNTSVKITVTPYNNNRRGQSSQVSKVMPDLTAPQGSFSLVQTGRDVTITQTALSDDLSAAGAITRVVSWDDGTAAAPWSSGTTTTHTYPLTGIWHPTVTLTDAAGNSATVPLGVAVLGDSTAPTGTYTAGPSSAWASFSTVALTQNSIDDGDFSAPDDIRRTVDWGDGTAAAPWATGTAAEHKYAAGGTYTPKVTLTDEAGNSAEYAATPVAVTVDSVAPVVKLRVPRVNAKSVKSWRTLKGRASDSGVGVGTVRVKAIEKRGTTWYGYRPATGTWVKASTKGAAWRQARAAGVTPTATGTWTTSLRRLTKGQLVVRTSGRDLVGNASKPVNTSQLLTRS